MDPTSEPNYTQADMLRALNVMLLSGMLTAEIDDDGEWVYRHSKKKSASPSIITFVKFMLEERYGNEEE